MTRQSPKDLLEALFALSRLDDLPRTGWILAGVPSPESVAGHVLGVCHLILACAPDEKPALDLASALSMALVHDAPEALSGDLPKTAGQALPDGAKNAMEGILAAQLLGPMGFGASQAWRDYQDQETREARFVKACDRLQMGVQALLRLRAGQRGLQGFGSGLAQMDWQEFPTLAALWDTVHTEWVGFESIPPGA